MIERSNLFGLNGLRRSLNVSKKNGAPSTGLMSRARVIENSTKKAVGIVSRRDRFELKAFLRIFLLLASLHLLVRASGYFSGLVVGLVLNSSLKGRLVGAVV